MSFLKDIGKILSDGAYSIGGYSIVDIDGECVYIDGIVKILEISTTSIQLATRRKVLHIQGTCLSIIQSTRDCIVIKGDIVSLTKRQ